MAKKWADRTRKEKWAIIGSSIASVFIVGSIASATNEGDASTSNPLTTRSQSTPVVTTKDITETSPEPYLTVTNDDPTLDAGTSKVITSGVNGVRTKVATVTYSDGVEQSRVVISDTVTTQPVNEVMAKGTRPKQSCDPNYSGACVPVASDVDCAGGSGNGPAYVSGPVYVTGSDIYRLDSDGDGVGCE